MEFVITNLLKLNGHSMVVVLHGEKTYGGVRQYTKDGAIYNYVNEAEKLCDKWWRHKHKKTCYDQDITDATHVAD